jgi:hypothetical protein
MSWYDRMEYVFLPPLPDGQLRVEVRFLADREVLPGERKVPRTQAEQAEIEETWPGNRVETRRTSVAEADDCIARIQEFQADAHRQLWEWAATIVPRCDQCGIVLRPWGLHELHYGRIRAMTDLSAWNTSTLPVQLYVCDRCGSVKQFLARGPLPHPLPATVPSTEPTDKL